MNSLFVDDNRIHDDAWYAVWRSGDVVGVRIVGALTDAKNPVRRAWLDDEFDKHGWPRFIALDVKDALPAASLPKRLQTGLWAKRVLSGIEQGSVHLGLEASVSLTVRASLRVAGMGNIVLRHADAEFDADVAAFVAGRAAGNGSGNAGNAG